MNKLRALIQTHGLIDAIIHIVSRVVRAASLGKCELRRHYFFSQPVRTIPLLPARRGANISVRAAAPDDAIVASFPRPQPEIAARFACGAECLVAEISGTLAGFFWLQAGGFWDEEVGSHFSPSPAAITVWDFDMYVDPKHRGGLVFARLWDAVNQHLSQRGVRFSVSRVLADNEDSLRAHARLGAFPVGSAIGIAVGRRRWLISTLRMQPLPSAGKNPHVSRAVPAEENARKPYRRFARLAGAAPPTRTS
jgi:GNAT superfamily N-acetyltransferase